jgi:hypothetical protein
LNAQEIVAANVAARGYRDGWTAEQFVARQLCKLTEELGEAVRCITPESAAYQGQVGAWIGLIQDAGRCARVAFDDHASWRYLFHLSKYTPAELADMQVVLFAAAAALDFDVVQAAIDKSSADVARGVR